MLYGLFGGGGPASPTPPNPMITPEQLALHDKWLNNESDGVRLQAQNANLHGANLTGANLTGAILTRANLYGASLTRAIGLPIVDDAPQRLQSVAATVLSNDGATLAMGKWHTCDTTHCLAGWAIHQAGTIGKTLESLHGPHLAGLLLLGHEAASHFYDNNEDATEWLRSVVQKG